MYAYIILLYLIPMVVLLFTKTEDVNSGASDWETSDYFFIFLPVLNLLTVVIAFILIVYTLFDDPKYFFRR